MTVFFSGFFVLARARKRSQRLVSHSYFICPFINSPDVTGSKYLSIYFSLNTFWERTRNFKENAEKWLNETNENQQKMLPSMSWWNIVVGRDIIFIPGRKRNGRLIGCACLPPYVWNLSPASSSGEVQFRSSFPFFDLLKLLPLGRFSSPFLSFPGQNTVL